MVLVGIVTGGRKDEVGRSVIRHALQDVLDAIPNAGSRPSGKLVQVDGDDRHPEERLAAALRASAWRSSVPGEHHVTNTHSGPALGKGEQGSARPDLDVIGMGADRQDGQRPLCRQLEIQRKHGRQSALRREGRWRGL